MARSSKARSGKSSGKSSGKHSGKQSAKSPAQAAPQSPAAVVMGAVFLIVSLGAALGLSLQHLSGLSLPGCGAGGGCAAVQNSAWGSIPGIGFPTSHLGAAYFAGLLLAWFFSRGSLSMPLRWLVRFGIVGSLVFMGAMAEMGAFCEYCLATHVGNILFLALVEVIGRRSAPMMGNRPIVAWIVTFVIATGGLAVAESVTTAKVAAKDEEDLKQSTDEIIKKGTTTEEVPTEVFATVEPFTGRYRHGPEKAAIRIVVFSDFQCPDCFQVEEQIRELLAQRDDISVSMKQFPFCTDCNPIVPRNLHPNACWAARASEMAGIMGGNDAFWILHDWLFDKKGVFNSTGELIEGATLAGLDGRELARRMQEETARLDALIQSDIDEAVELGLNFTPMVFVNGVELKGFRRRGALISMVDAVAASNPPVRGPEADRPPVAREKYIQDWQDARGTGRRLTMRDATDWTRGPADAKVRVVVFGDYASSFGPRIDAAIQKNLEGIDSVSYSFRHYPFNQECNDHIKRTAQPNGCLAAKAVEAAGILMGPDGYWAMHAWLLSNQDSIDTFGLRAGAEAIGTDPDALLSTMESPEVEAAIKDDVNMARRIGAQGFPAIIVNERYVPRWKLGDDVLLGEIFRRAAEEE